MRIYQIVGRHYANLAVPPTIIALPLSLPFAIAYFRAYEPQAIPSWMDAFAKAFPELFESSARTRVYQIYGRLYSFVIPLTIPALLAMKSRIGTDTRILLWGWCLFLAGVLLMGVGIFGDYRPAQEGFLISLGFMFEMIAWWYWAWARFSME